MTWTVEGRQQVVGFYKNETVLAGSMDQAVEASKDRVRHRLKAGSHEFQVDWDSFSIEVDSVRADFRVWRLLERQGFVFYPIEERLS